MTKNKNQSASAPRMSRRYSVLDIVARRITGNSKITWSTFSTRFTSSVLPTPITESDLENSVVSSKIVSLLEKMLAEAVDNSKHYQTGRAKDIEKLLENNPRGKKTTV